MKFNQTDYKKRNISMWNEVAPRYHKRWASINKGPFVSTSKLIQLLNLKKGDSVFDVACGTGVVTKKIRQKVGNVGLVIGGDTSFTALKIAKKWNPKTSNLNFVNIDAENFCFSKKFDVITCQYALFFFPDALKALKNMKKHLKNNGKLGITVHGQANKVPYFSSIVNAVSKIIPDYFPPDAPDLDRFATKIALKNEVKKAGFSKICVSDFVFNFSPGTVEDYWSKYQRYVSKPLREKLQNLNHSEKKELKNLVRKNVKPYTQKNKKINFPWEVLILTANNKK